MQVDPFLCLVGDSKLQVSAKTVGPNKIGYGSKDDDNSAQRCLSEIKLKDDQTADSLISVILNNLDNSAEVSSNFIVSTSNYTCNLLLMPLLLLFVIVRGSHKGAVTEGICAR